MGRWLREPLLHFLLLGFAIFTAFAVLRPDERPRSSIVVTQGIIDGQVEAFSRTWLRPPTPQEIDGLIREYVREEVYYREGVALGLDRDDTVIRRRLMQKLEFVTEAAGATAEPSDDELRAYLQAHADSYREDTRISFEHVYLNTDRRGSSVAGDAQRLLAALRTGGATVDPATLGDATLLDRAFADASIRDVAARFGDAFAARLEALPVGEWQGPVDSAYGKHLVRIAGRSDGRPRPLDEVRENVRRDWLNERRVAASEQYYRSLLQNYTVTIEGRGTMVLDGAPGSRAP